MWGRVKKEPNRREVYKKALTLPPPKAMLLPVAIVALRSTSLVGPAAVVNRQAIRMFAADGDGLLVACQVFCVPQ